MGELIGYVFHLIKQTSFKITYTKAENAWLTLKNFGGKNRSASYHAYVTSFLKCLNTKFLSAVSFMFLVSSWRLYVHVGIVMVIRNKHELVINRSNLNVNLTFKLPMECLKTPSCSYCASIINACYYKDKILFFNSFNQVTLNIILWK